MKVPFFEYRTSLEERYALEYAASTVLRSGRFILGEEVSNFEQECAAYLGAKYAVGVSSGTDALLMCLMGANLSPGDRVVVPAFTFVATASAVVRAGAIPVFVDVRDDDMTMDMDAALRACRVRASERPKRVIPVHLFGAEADVTTLADGLPRGTFIIEDCAQSFGSSRSIHQTECHSFFPTKNLGGFGDGGLIATASFTGAEYLRATRNHGAGIRYRHDSIGGNFRLDALQAALLRVRLANIDAALTARRSNASRYLDGLNDTPVRCPYGQQATFNQFVIRVPFYRDALREYLAECGIGTEIYYPTPLHLQPCFAYLGHRPGDFPVAELAAAEVLALPIFPGLREDEIDYVCEKINEFFAMKRS